METQNTGAGPFRYRKSVRAIAVTDGCIAFFMLTLFGLKCQMDLCSALFNEKPNVLTVITIVIFGVYALQLVMAQILMTATYQTDIPIILSRCQKWYLTSQFLHVILGMELFVVVFSIRGGTPFAFTICIMKIVFRAVANHLVKMFMWDLRTTPPAYPFIATISYPFAPFDRSRLPSFAAPSGTPGISIPNYEAPPSYEDAIKEKSNVEDFTVDIVGLAAIPPAPPPPNETGSEELTLRPSPPAPPAPPAQPPTIPP